jgi:hypothetical protein
MAAVPSPSEKRIAKYIAKTAPTTVGLKIAAMLESMKSNFTPVTEDLVDMMTLVQIELAANHPAVHTIDYGRYYAYAEELWKLLRTTSQPTADAEAQIIHDKWEARGLVTATLIAIASNVFNITVT